ncbi:hypothetical protein [Streptomyces sp. NPDC007883]|uniref:hypothetical protein n=1 Tax=Streptomyces sp. NPDC007883 TaxID=3155116 RepID=UPI0033CE0AE9
MGLVLGSVLLLRDGDAPQSRSETEARKLAAHLAPAAEHWGTDFVGVGEADDSGEASFGEDCVAIPKSDRAGTLASVIRWAERKKPPALGTQSEARVYENAATAEAYIEDIEDGIHRCPTQQIDKARFEDIRETAALKLSGFDELVAEQGRWVLGEEGEKLNRVYVALTGRKNEIVLSTLVDGPPGTEEELHQIAAKTLQGMQTRLAEQ